MVTTVVGENRIIGEVSLKLTKKFVPIFFKYIFFVFN